MMIVFTNMAYSFWAVLLFVPTYCFKWILAYVVLRWRRIMTSDQPDIFILPSVKEKNLERPRAWAKEETFKRDSMLVFAASQDVWLLLEIVRGRYNSAVARVRLQFTNTGVVYQSSGEDGRPRACEEWTTDCLAFQCLEPMRRWRIVFTGRLQCKTNKKNHGRKLVKINLIWAALNGPHHYETSADICAVASAVAEQPYSQLQQNLDSLGKGYEQWGTVQGAITADDTDIDLHTPSLRRHCWKWPHTTGTVGVVGLANTGTLFSINYNFSRFRTQVGHIRYADGRVEKLVGNSDIDGLVVPGKFVRNFKSNCHSHQIYVVRRPFERWGSLRFASARCCLDSQQAACIVMSWSRDMKEELPKLPFLTFSAVESSSLAVSLDNPACSNPEVVGGKAASLALLTDMAQSVLRNKMKVPTGFCLTVHAMKLQIESSPSINSAIKFLDLVSRELEQGNLQEQCQHVVTTWLSADICPAVVAALVSDILPNRSYAVRSSALSEDCEQSSSAGQNMTVLGCVGVDAVLVAVLKCWASLYTYQSVQYRRHSGLPVESLMAVVVQEMVEAEVAGVMFTRHPVTCDPSQLLITANYGLGETVVSGSVEPDSIVVNIENPSNMQVEMAIKGRKTSKLVVNGEGGTMQEAVDADEMETVCLTEAEVIALAQLGVSLEQLFGWPKDIEWAIKKGVIYLLQCRPITSLFAWSQEELTHELDTAILPDEASTTANTGEVLPGATSPLTQSTVMRCCDAGVVRYIASEQDHLWYNNRMVIFSHHHALLNLYRVLAGHPEQPSLFHKVVEICVCGHQVSTPQLLRTAVARRTPLSLWQTLQAAVTFVKLLMLSRSDGIKAQSLGEQFKLDFDNLTSAGAIYAYLSTSFTQLQQIFHLHSKCSIASTVWQTILFRILAEGKSELTEEHVQDIALLLVNEQAAVSAHVPADVKKLTQVIKRCERWEELANIELEKIPVWLRRNCPEGCSLLEDISRRYEHRNIKELDVMTRPWGLDNTPLLSMVQTLLCRSENLNTDHGNKHETNADVVDKLQSPKKRITRWLIHLLRRKASSAAARREVSKDACLRMVHQLRLGYIKLAKLMVQEGRLPTSQLVWFCTNYELSVLLHHPDPAWLHRIHRRQRSWQQWDQLQFPSVMVGLPEPVHLLSHPTISNEQYVQGTLVCPGSVEGRACVLLSCTDTRSLRAGDVLITHSTDVGWTPLFPMLAGVVTELGGLISHGAVVAREYGLPCVVGATNATLVFKTGDKVYLDGKSGKVQKISS